MKSPGDLNLIMKLNSSNLEPKQIHRLRDEFVAGNDKAFAMIYELLAKEMFAFGLSLGMKPQIIEDAIHDIFVNVYLQREHLDRVDNLKYYFLASFRNRLFFLLKKDSLIADIPDTEMMGIPDKDVQEKWIEREEMTEQQRLVKRLFSELNKNQQEALYHRFVEGLSDEEIATLMNINYQSAKNLIHRAIQKLRTVKVLLRL